VNWSGAGLLDAPFLGDVPRDDDDPVRGAIRVTQETDVRLYRVCRVVLAALLDFDYDRHGRGHISLALPGELVRELFRDAIKGLGRDELSGVVSYYLFYGEPGLPFYGGACVGHDEIQVRCQNYIAGTLHKQAVVLLALAQRLLSGMAARA